MIRKNRFSHRCPFALLALAAAILGLSTVAHADPAPAGPPAPAAVVVPPAPAPAPAPGASTETPPPARKEEETETAGNPAPGASSGSATPPAPNIFARAAALMQSKGALAGEIAALKKERDEFKAQLVAANGTIATLNAELGELRAGKQSLEAALKTAEGDAKGVAETVAGLGFNATQLPPNQPADKAGDVEEGFLAQFIAERDPAKKSEIFGRLQAHRATKQAAKK